MGKDPVMVDLDRYLNEIDEDYVDPYDREQDRMEYLADQIEDHDEEF